MSLVECSAERIRLNADTSAEEGSLGTLDTNTSVPLGAEEIRRSRVVDTDLNEGTVSAADGVSLVAGETSTVGAIEGLAQRIDLGTEAIVEVGVDAALVANISSPPGAEEISGASGIGSKGDQSASTALESVASIAGVAPSVGIVESLAVRVNLPANSVLPVGIDSALGAFSVGVKDSAKGSIEAGSSSRSRGSTSLSTNSVSLVAASTLSGIIPGGTKGIDGLASTRASNEPDGAAGTNSLPPLSTTVVVGSIINPLDNDDWLIVPINSWVPGWLGNSPSLGFDNIVILLPLGIDSWVLGGFESSPLVSFLFVIINLGDGDHSGFDSRVLGRSNIAPWVSESNNGDLGSLSPDLALGGLSFAAIIGPSLEDVLCADGLAVGPGLAVRFSATSDYDSDEEEDYCQTLCLHVSNNK